MMHLLGSQAGYRHAVMHEKKKVNVFSLCKPSLLNVIWCAYFWALLKLLGFFNAPPHQHQIWYVVHLWLMFLNIAWAQIPNLLVVFFFFFGKNLFIRGITDINNYYFLLSNSCMQNRWHGFKPDLLTSIQCMDWENCLRFVSVCMSFWELYWCLGLTCYDVLINRHLHVWVQFMVGLTC